MISAAIATISGREKQLALTMGSLVTQVDLITYEKDHPKGDAAKFITEVDGYFFSCDDDLLYPCDYVMTMISKLKEYDNKIIVACLGRTLLNFPIRKYYKSSEIEKIGCFQDCKDTWVHIGGSGVMAFHTDYFRPDLDEFKNGYMADIWVSIQAQREKIPILCIEKSGSWLWSQPTDNGIYERYKDNDTEQVDAVNSITWNIYQPLKIK